MEVAGSFHEKGVDVQLAIDMLVGAYENQYDTAIMISSDTDLLPAVKKVRQLHKTVEYIGFIHQPSIALKNQASSSRLLTRKDVLPFTAQRSHHPSATRAQR